MRQVISYMHTCTYVRFCGTVLFLLCLISHPNIICGDDGWIHVRVCFSQAQ